MAAGKPQGAHTFFWMWKATLPHLLHRVCVLLRLIPKDEVPLVILRLFFFSETLEACHSSEKIQRAGVDTITQI